LKPLGYHCSSSSTHAFISLIIFWPEKYDFDTCRKELKKKQKDTNLPDF
jgi:hypothetical protein